jgi:hypothetical protein
VLILGLDISKTRTGAALGAPGSAPVFSSIVGRDETNVGAMVKLGRWLIALTKEQAIDAIYFEATISPGAFMGDWNPDKGKVELSSNPQTWQALAKMTGVVEFVADMRSIPAIDVNVFTLRKLFLGDGRPARPKQQALALCRLLGWSPGNLDEADAGAVWYFGAAERSPRTATLASPMQQQKAAREVTPCDVIADGGDVFALTYDDLGQAHISAKDAAKVLARRRA